MTPDDGIPRAEGNKKPLPIRIERDPPLRPRELPVRPGAIPIRPGAVPTRPQASVQRPVPMANSASTAVEEPEVDRPLGRLAEMKLWVAETAGAYLASMLFHAALFLVLFLVLGARYIHQKLTGGASFEAMVLAAPEDETPPLNILKMLPGDDEDLRKLPLIPEPGENKKQFTEGTPTIIDFDPIDDNPVPIAPGGSGIAEEIAQVSPMVGSLDVSSFREGRAIPGISGYGSNDGKVNALGKGGNGNGFGHRKGQGTPGGRPGGPGEKSVAAALRWLARHQNKSGSWSLSRFSINCTEGVCSGHGSAESDAAGTAMGLLPFLASGYTHHKPNIYQQTVYRGVTWLITHQNPSNGDLSAGSGQMMYSHGLATIALCEAYGMSGDDRVGRAAQAAINFIQFAQDKQGGGWRYKPGEAGDTSVVGWQVMALKSGQMAKLQVNQRALDGAKKFLAAASGSEYGAKFGYTPGAGGTPTMSGVGLLCRQYLGAAKDDPGLIEGSKYLMVNLPDPNANRNIYYWYYATQVMHNMQGDDWQTWDLKMRRTLKKTQERQGCAAGSWDPDKPTADAWGQHGGRVMMTSLSCLTLEVYYRYLPLYDLGKQGVVKGELQ
ncbi:MAG: terpene cyclase/mutase family protein [Planctomycetes bacterium]|nr:terpene cyclase/mutase family protein [Planctomycetota bacterium]